MQAADRSSIRRVMSDGDVIDLEAYLCDAARCPIGIGRRPYYLDTHHMNESGAMRTVPAFEALFGRIAAGSVQNPIDASTTAAR